MVVLNGRFVWVGDLFVSGRKRGKYCIVYLLVVVAGLPWAGSFGGALFRLCVGVGRSGPAGGGMVVPCPAGVGDRTVSDVCVVDYFTIATSCGDL